MNKLVKKTLENLNLGFEFSDNHFIFEYLGIKMRIDEKCKISVPSDFFGKIPHVMEDGEVCVFSGIDAYIESYEDFELRETIITYIPYLFGLSPEERVSEMLLELDFYIPAILQRNCLQGLILLGTWHSHPFQVEPFPSSVDTRQWKKWSSEYIHIIVGMGYFKIFKNKISFLCKKKLEEVYFEKRL